MKYLLRYNENMNLSKSIMNKKMEDYENLKKMLSKNLGFIGKFTEYLMNENIPYSELEKLYSEIINLKKKNVSIDINKLKYEKALDLIQSSNEDLMISGLINKFPSEQKKIARELLSDKKSYYRNIFIKVSQKSNIENFISKISRYKSTRDLTAAMKIFSKDPINDRDQISKVLSEMKSKIVFNDNNIIVVFIDSYTDLCKIGSDTSWCIVSSESTYNSYTRGRYQFVLYNYNLDEFDPKFKIGFTITQDGLIHTSHDVLDSLAIGETNKILSDNNINVLNIIPRIDPISFDIKKISAGSSTDKLKRIASECDLKIIPELIKKVCNSAKNGDSKQQILRRCFARLYAGREFVMKSDLDKISDKFYDHVRYEHNIITKFFDKNLTEPAFKKGLEIWSDKSYSRIGMDTVKKSKFSNETLTILSDKLNDIYLNDKISWEDIGWNEDSKGVKLSKEYEGVMLVLNAILGRVEKTPDYEILIKTPNYVTEYYNDILRMPIDLGQHYGQDFDEDELDLIVKKNYESSNISIQRSLNYPFKNKYTKLINHLNGYKIRLYISKDTLREIILKRETEVVGNERIMSLLDKFNLKIDIVNNKRVVTGRLVSGKEFSDNQLTIKLK